MFTQCPTCETVFRVSDADLSAADGQVRCSQCEGVFDARAHLRENQDSTPALGAGTIDLGATGPSIGDLFGAEVAPLETAAAKSLLIDPVPNLAGAEVSPDLVATGGAMAADSGMPAAVGAPAAQSAADFPPLPDAGRPRERMGRWLVASVVLGFALVGQLVHANRDHLARDPQVGTLVVDAYQSMKLPIVAPVDLSALAVARTEVTSHPLYDDVLFITATVTNDAPFPQPLPLLRVRLDDRWGEALGTRLFTPQEYLRTPPNGNQRAEPGRAYAIALEVVDPGSDAVGYALAPCLPIGKSIICSGDDPNAR